MWKCRKRKKMKFQWREERELLFFVIVTNLSWNSCFGLRDVDLLKDKVRKCYKQFISLRLLSTKRRWQKSWERSRLARRPEKKRILKVFSVWVSDTAINSFSESANCWNENGTDSTRALQLKLLLLGAIIVHPILPQSFELLQVKWTTKLQRTM